MINFLTDLMDKAMDRAPLLQRRCASFFEPTKDAVGNGFLHGGRWQSESIEAKRESSIDILPTMPTIERVSPSMAPKVSPTETTSQPFVDRKVIHREDAVIDNTVTDKQGWEHYEAPVTEPKKDLPLQLSSEPMAHQEQSSRSIETIRERQVVVIPQANPFIPEKSTGNKSVNKKDIAAEHTVVASPRAIIAIGDQHKKNDVEHVVHVSKEREKGAAISVKPIKSADSENFHSRIRNQNTTARLQAPVNQAAASMINVSIGRIEIRATTTPSSPVRDRRQTTPKLNLEEYLRVRSGGSK